MYTTQKTKDRATQTPLKTRDKLRDSGRVEVPAPLVMLIVLLLLQTLWCVMNEKRTGLGL